MPTLELPKLARFQISANRKKKIEERSKGNQQKVQFLATVLHDPAILVMDEPFSGLDLINANVLKEAFLEMHIQAYLNPNVIVEAALHHGRIISRFELAEPSRSKNATCNANCGCTLNMVEALPLVTILLRTS
jgi:ABC-type transporter Mla maintaining outer membrane lipid asymmetry ATPase subunit MlaF